MSAGEEDDILYSSATVLPLSGVLYSCGACGYQLNLSSCNRDTSATGFKYEKSLKKGVVPFFSIDETRFTQREELKCKPFFTSKHSWGLFQRRTQLFCRKCGNFVGFASKGRSYSRPISKTLSKSGSLPGHVLPDNILYYIKLGSIQPGT